MEQTRKAIFLDIDGTLVPQGRRGSGAEDRAMIELAHNAGHLVFLSTARSLANIPAEFGRAPWLDGIIAAAGAHVLLRTQAEFTTVYHTCIPVEQISKMCELYAGTGRWCLFEGERDLYALNRITRIIPEQEPRVIQTKDDFLVKYRDPAISKLTMDGDITKAEREILGGILNLYPQAGFHEGIIKGESKSKGMQRALEAVGISRENSIAIGDSANDLDMIRFAGIGIAMGNACDELKDSAAYITADVENCGVAQALRKYL
jgi:Cof subfamily protein (haloacid dehalogenase superfamily)